MKQMGNKWHREGHLKRVAFFYFIGNQAISYKVKNAPLWVHNVRWTLVMDGPERSVDRRADEEVV